MVSFIVDYFVWMFRIAMMSKQKNMRTYISPAWYRQTPSLPQICYQLRRRLSVYTLHTLSKPILLHPWVVHIIYLRNQTISTPSQWQQPTLLLLLLQRYSLFITSPTQCLYTYKNILHFYKRGNHYPSKCQLIMGSYKTFSLL